MSRHLHSRTEILYRQQQVRTTYIEVQRQITISGVRQIIGNTLLEIGSRIHGMAQAACPEAAESRSLIREARRAREPVASGLIASLIH